MVLELRDQQSWNGKHRFEVCSPVVWLVEWKISDFCLLKGSLKGGRLSGLRTFCGNKNGSFNCVVDVSWVITSKHLPENAQIPCFRLCSIQFIYVASICNKCRHKALYKRKKRTCVPIDPSFQSEYFLFFLIETTVSWSDSNLTFTQTHT